MALRQVRHSGYIKGVNASVSYPSQPPRTVARVSNFVLTTRGALRSCDQNVGICTLNGAGPAPSADDHGPFLKTQFYQPSSTSRQVLAWWRDFTAGLAPPSGLTATPTGSGGSLAPGTYYYKVTALDGAGGETEGSNEATAIVTGTEVVDLSWTAVTNAYAYNVYRGTVPGGELLLVASGLPVLAPTTTFVDDGSGTASSSYALTATPNGAILYTRRIPGAHGATIIYWAQFYPVNTGLIAAVSVGTTFTVTGCTPSLFDGGWTVTGTGSNYISANATSGQTGTSGTTGGGGDINLGAVPAVNTTTGLNLVDVSGLEFLPFLQSSGGNIVYQFPTSPYQPIPPFPQGATGGSQSGLAGGGTINSPAAGGIVGLTCPIPDLVIFAGKVILVMGNGYPPYLSQGTTATTTALTNTFTGAFPGWVADTAYNQGDVIQPDTPNGHVYIAYQGGVSGGSEPTFPTGSKQTVSDGSIIWQEDGSNAVVAPRGAAHAINHFGSLWLWNTYPTDTSDGLDGPSVLKMSDSNNPNSWNPLNVATVGKDDNQQGMGMASFTIAETGISPTGSLVLFKEFSTYQVTGVFGATDFSIQEAQTDMGCIAPRTIQFVPGFGIVRLTHLGFAVFDGVRDKLISEEIRPYLFGGMVDIAQMDFSWAYTSKACLTVQPPMYCAAVPVIGNGGDGQLTRIFCYDLVLKAWTIIDIPWAGITSLDLLEIPGSQPLTVMGGWLDAMISRWQAGDQWGWQAWLTVNNTITTGSALTASVRPPTVLGSAATDRTFFRRCIFRGTWSSDGLNSTSPNAVPSTEFTATLRVDQQTRTVQVTEYNTPSGSGLTDPSFQLVLDIGANGLDSDVTLVCTQEIGGSPVELDEDVWQVVARPIGALARAG